MRSKRKHEARRARMLKFFALHPHVLPLKLLLAVYRSARENTGHRNEKVAVDSIAVAALLRPILVARVEWMSSRMGRRP